VLRVGRREVMAGNSYGRKYAAAAAATPQPPRSFTGEDSKNSLLRLIEECHIRLVFMA